MEEDPVLCQISPLRVIGDYVLCFLEEAMEYNTEKVDEMALALLYISMFSDGLVTRAWKGLSYEITDRLFEKGFIFDPKGKAKSVVFTDEGKKMSEELFIKYFGLPVHS
jgi:hypothetical protein